MSGGILGQFLNLAGGDDSAIGSDGRDLLQGGAGNDSLLDGLGNDTVLGRADVDTIQGGDGIDVISGGSGSDSLPGRAGNDDFRGPLMSDVSGLAETIDGGTDSDTLDFQPEGAPGAADISVATLISLETLLPSGTELTLRGGQLGAFGTVQGIFVVDRIILSSAGSADLTGASISGIEEFRGNNGADTFLLDEVANGQLIDGLGGSDSKSGTPGADLIEGGGGPDSLAANEVNDTIRG